MTFTLNYFLPRFDTLVLFFEYLDSGAKIRKFGATISSFFNSLSNETTPTEIGQKLWDQLHFW